MPLVEHLRELRYRLTVSLVALAVGFLLAYLFKDQLLDVVVRPYCASRVQDAGCNLNAFSPTDELQALLRVSFTGAVIFSAPVWAYQLGRFITPALHPQEKRVAGAFAVASALLFVTGVVFAYVILERALGVLLDIFGDDVDPVQGVLPYLRFVTLMLLAFGAAFEFPMLVMFGHLVGLLPVSRLVAWRRGVIFGLAVFTAVVTPTTDPFTFLALMLPLVALYEICILLARLRERRRRRAAAADPLADVDDDETSPLDLAADPAQEVAGRATGPGTGVPEARGSRLAEGERPDGG